MKKERTKRRDRGAGCIRQRMDGRWEGRFSQEMEPPVYVYGKTKKDVQDKFFALQRQPRQLHDPEGLTTGEWLDRWLDLVKADPKLTLATYDLYKHQVDKHMKPYIESIKLSKLSKTDLYDMFDALAKDKV